MRRFGQVIDLKEGVIARYEALHADPWPEVLEILRAGGIGNYSIFRHGSMLFQYFEYHGDDFDRDMEVIGASPVIQQWWDVCKPLQEPRAERAEGEWWLNMTEIFRMD